MRARSGTFSLRYLLCGGILAWGLAGSFGVGLVRADDISEYGLKAVLFYRLPQFVYWPEGRLPQPAVLCVAGQTPLTVPLGQLPQGDGGLIIRQVGTDLAGCHQLYIARSERGNLDAWLQRADPRGVLTVSDIPGFARYGGMVELVLDNGRVGMLINRRAAQRRNLDFNAQVLRLARLIEP